MDCMEKDSRVSETVEITKEGERPGEKPHGDSLLLSIILPAYNCEAFLASLNNGNEENILLDDIPVSADSHILTLSTCNAYDDQRYLVQCLLVQPGQEGTSSMPAASDNVKGD